ncbi:hypothetical protein [Mesorhizobium sp. M1027]|uniref:hypothetical protein n=1 Tax=Mesorhizobium sp. M1027 TaxID=2957050 RepID=UPI0033354B54
MKADFRRQDRMKPVRYPTKVLGYDGHGECYSGDGPLGPAGGLNERHSLGLWHTLTLCAERGRDRPLLLSYFHAAAALLPHWAVRPVEKWIRIKPCKTDKSKVRSQPVVVELPLLPELAAELSCALAGNGSR